MADVKHMDIAEFQRLGFLQEANRQFFHPHGLALELTSVDEPGYVSLSLTHEQFEALKEALEPERIAGDRYCLQDVLAAATHRNAGDKWISGIWDCRDDPEGIVFGSGSYGDSQERADTVAAQRAKHTDARKALFGTDSDVEPLDWTHPES